MTHCSLCFSASPEMVDYTNTVCCKCCHVGCAMYRVSFHFEASAFHGSLFSHIIIEFMVSVPARLAVVTQCQVSLEDILPETENIHDTVTLINCDCVLWTTT